MGVTLTVDHFRGLVNLIRNGSIQSQIDKIEAVFQEKAEKEKQKKMERKLLREQQLKSGKKKKKKTKKKKKA